MKSDAERQQLIERMKAKFGLYVEKYFESFDEAGSKNSYGIPTITQIEKLWQETNKETRELLVTMVDDSINNVDESKMIELKKVNTNKKE